MLPVLIRMKWLWSAFASSGIGGFSTSFRGRMKLEIESEFCNRSILTYFLALLFARFTQVPTLIVFAIMINDNTIRLERDI